MTEPRAINLALQGGGAHGAFTWGVLDRLLEDERIVIEGISGTSAGAINGAVLAQGMHKGGRDGAREALDRFWRRVSDFDRMSPVRRTWYDRITGNWNLDASPGAVWLDMMVRILSPYQFNPANLSPFREILEEAIDADALRACKAVKLFVSATNVETGKNHVFSGADVSIDALLASTCLPFLFQAVVIDGTPYWDGGYLGNPAIYPLIYHCISRDVLIVEINPIFREGVPRTAAEIVNRVNEISFNSSLMYEMRAIAFVQKLIEDNNVVGPGIDRLKKMLIHLIEAEETMKDLGVASKLNAEMEFLLFLKDHGRRTVDAWLEQNFAALGSHSTVDIRGRFL